MAGSKGARRIGSANDAGVLGCAQDDSKNNNDKDKQRQGQTTTRTNNDKDKQRQGQKQIPFGDDNKRWQPNSAAVRINNGGLASLDAHPCVVRLGMNGKTRGA
jgi:hypothetical protein